MQGPPTAGLAVRFVLPGAPAGGPPKALPSPPSPGRSCGPGAVSEPVARPLRQHTHKPARIHTARVRRRSREHAVEKASS